MWPPARLPFSAYGANRYMNSTTREVYQDKFKRAVVWLRRMKMKAAEIKRVWRQQIQMAIEQGRLIFSQYAMKVDTHPFPAVNMVECTYPGRCQPGFSFNINMVGPVYHHWDGDEVEVVQADDSAEISMAGMNVWETTGQEPLSGITLDDCERIDVTKDGVRLVLSTGLTV
ncbi:hypothetical protein QYE76_015569 [Lolium multiflorum]|uniref:Uncharacterized protein n=1 Tax=Lolium multiflorum TaxID=4521 RepID=A0AAD8U524_LOLMU|nr:hypothetical protein QYE76_015569 [Lolium multiflorum]